MLCKCSLLKCPLMRVENFAKFTEVVLYDGLSKKFGVKTSFCFSTETYHEKQDNELFFQELSNKNAVFKTGLIKKVLGLFFPNFLTISDYMISKQSSS